MFSLFQIASRDDPLANPKSVRLWASALAVNDPVGAVEAMIELLDRPDAVDAVAEGNRLRALLELDRICVPLQEKLEAQHRATGLSDDVRERLWRACDTLARTFAQIYERVGAGFGETRAGSRPPAELHGIFARLFYHVGIQARHGLFRYEQWIPGRWRALHAAYTEACRHAVVAEPYAAGDSRNPPLSPEQEYLQVLLIQRLNTGNLGAHQIDLAADWLRDWVPQLRLAMRQPEGDGYWLDLGRGEGLLAVRPDAPKGELLYLDVAPLQERLNERLEQLTAVAAAKGTGTGTVDAELDEQLDLARRLDALWLPSAGPRSRRGERRSEQRAVTVAVGWRDIASAVAVSPTSLPRNDNAPAGYHYDDDGRLWPNALRKPVLPAGSRSPGRDVWQVHDVSDSGFRVRASTSFMSGHRLGALLVLQLEGDTRWQVGIVRRIKKLNAEQMELGVEMIARNALLVVPRAINSRSSGYSVDGVDVGSKAKSFTALYLPGQPRLRVGARPSIVLPPAEFTVGRTLSVHVEGEHHAIVLAPPLERSKDWVWTALSEEVVANNERRP